MRQPTLRRCSGHARAFGCAFLALSLCVVAGCNVRVNKSNDGDDVKIATPFGEIAVNKDLTTASDLGLPAYPGSALDAGDDGNKSAKVDLGVGEFRLRVKMANYTTSDKREEVLAFYRKALSQYGGVIECADEKPYGPPATNSGGLSCDHHERDHGPHLLNLEKSDLELKAGSERHQHLVVLHKGAAPTTRFTLIALDLPHGMDNEEKGTN